MLARRSDGQAERGAAPARLAGMVVVAGFFVTILAVGWLTAAIRPVLPWWSIVTANTLAVIPAGWYLIKRHPGVWRRLLPLPA